MNIKLQYKCKRTPMLRNIEKNRVRRSLSKGYILTPNKVGVKMYPFERIEISYVYSIVIQI